MLLSSAVPLNETWSLNNAYAPFTALVNPSVVAVSVSVVMASLGAISLRQLFKRY